MILLPSSSTKDRGFGRREGVAFTLVEVLMVMAIFLLIVEGVVYTHLFGLRLYTLTASKMGATDSARQAISRMVDDIRSSKWVYVGTGSLSGFSYDVSGSNQTGNSIQVFISTNTNFFVRYFWDPADMTLKRTTNGTSSSTIVVQAITNAIVFDAEDQFGNILTNNYNNRVIGVNMQFYQLIYPAMPIAPGQLYDYYRLRTKITRRILE